MSVKTFKDHLRDLVIRQGISAPIVKAAAERLNLPQDPANRKAEHYKQLLDALQKTDDEKETSPITVGAIVHKRHNLGWTGIVRSVDGKHAQVLWGLEKYLDRIRLEDLRLSAHTDRWQSYPWGS